MIHTLPSLKESSAVKNYLDVPIYLAFLISQSMQNWGVVARCLQHGEFKEVGGTNWKKEGNLTQAFNTFSLSSKCEFKRAHGGITACANAHTQFQSPKLLASMTLAVAPTGTQALISKESQTIVDIWTSFPGNTGQKDVSAAQAKVTLQYKRRTA